MLKFSRAAMVAFLFFHTILICSQNLPAGARSTGTGNTSVAVSDGWSVFNNQAGMAGIDKVWIGAFYENRFLIPEFNTQGIGIVLPFRKAGNFSVNFTRSGYSLYHSNKWGIGYARNFGKIFSAGIQINFHWIHLGDIYGDRFTATGEISIQVKPKPGWIIGFHVFNPTRTPLNPGTRENINTIFRLGSSYQFKEKVLGAVELEASIDQLPLFRCGIEYLPVKYVAIRMGMITYPFSPSLGLGFNLRGMQIDFASLWNPAMGFSPSGSLHYRFGK